MGPFDCSCECCSLCARSDYFNWMQSLINCHRVFSSDPETSNFIQGSLWDRSLWSIRQMFVLQTGTLVEFWLYRFFRWSSRKNRYFSCQDKEQLYCSVIPVWLCPQQLKCTWTKFYTLRKYRTEILLYIVCENYKKEHHVYLISWNVLSWNISGFTLMTKHLKHLK